MSLIRVACMSLARGYSQGHGQLAVGFMEKESFSSPGNRHGLPVAPQGGMRPCESFLNPGWTVARPGLVQVLPW